MLKFTQLLVGAQCVCVSYCRIPRTTVLTMSQEALLELKDVACSKAPGQPIFTHVNLTVNEGDVIILQGKSGSG